MSYWLFDLYQSHARYTDQQELLHVSWKEREAMGIIFLE